MILSSYRSNHPGALILLPFIAVLLWLPAFFGDHPDLSDPAPLIGFFEGFATHLPNWLNGLFGVILTVSGGVLFNRVVDQVEFRNKTNFLPAYTYVFFMSLLPEEKTFHPILITNILLILALRRILHISRQPNVHSHTFDAGLYIGIASLFYFPLVFTVPFIWFAVMILRSFQWREYVMPVLGTATPYAYSFVYYFWQEDLAVFGELLTFDGRGAFFPNISPTWLELPLLILLGATLTAGVINLLLSSRKRTMHNKRQKSIFLIFSLFIGIIAWVSSYDDMPYRQALAAIPLAGMVPFYFARKEWPWISGPVFYIWLLLAGGIIYFQLTG